MNNTEQVLKMGFEQIPNIDTVIKKIKEGEVLLDGGIFDGSFCCPMVVGSELGEDEFLIKVRCTKNVFFEDEELRNLYFNEIEINPQYNGELFSTALKNSSEKTILKILQEIEDERKS